MSSDTDLVLGKEIYLTHSKICREYLDLCDYNSHRAWHNLITGIFNKGMKKRLRTEVRSQVDQGRLFR